MLSHAAAEHALAGPAASWAGNLCPSRHGSAEDRTDLSNPHDDEGAIGDSDGIAELPAWSAYQERVAEFFRGLGLGSRTNVKVVGARASHDVDVLVEFTSAGIPITWVIECKAWKRAIPKERVLVLAGVVDDIGADRGIIVAESGFQGGAVRAAQHSNVTLTSLEDLLSNTEVERAQAEVSGCVGRISALHEDARRLWDWSPPNIPEGTIEVGRMIEFAADVFELHSMVLPKVASNSYPVLLMRGGDRLVARDAAELKPALDRRVREAENEAAALRTLMQVAADRADILVDALEGALSELLSAGRALDADLAAQPHGESPRFPAAMRTVGDAADALKAVVPSTVRIEVIVLMRWLIDDTYVVAERSRPDWDSDEISITAHVARIRDALRAARSRHISP